MLHRPIRQLDSDELTRLKLDQAVGPQPRTRHVYGNEVCPNALVVCGPDVGRNDMPIGLARVAMHKAFPQANCALEVRLFEQLPNQCGCKKLLMTASGLRTEETKRIGHYTGCNPTWRITIVSSVNAKQACLPLVQKSNGAAADDHDVP